jgi:nucleoside-diphosphate-sugar epimerase
VYNGGQKWSTGFALRVFISGGTGYIGTRLIRQLLGRRHAVAALARPNSAGKLPSGAKAIIGDALNAPTFSLGVTDCETFVHMIGVAHPSPAKAAEFRSIDLVSVKASVAAAREAGVKNFVYISVAQPAPVMQAYLDVRAECEQMITAAGFRATFLRPWYVVGPGHRWPAFLIPMYWLFEKIPSKREAALRLGLVTIQEVVEALAWAVENPPAESPRIISVPQIREAARTLHSTPGGGAAAPATETQ